MKQIRCALYPRVSTEEQVHGLSLDAQRKDLTEYAKRMNYKIIGVYADEGISARKPVSKRPALLKLLEDVKNDKIDIILVTKLDRWFRNIKEYQSTEEILKAHNCCWKTIYEDYDSSTANGQMVINIMLAVNQNECDRTSERIRAVFRHKVLNGEHLTGAAPYGYILKNKKLAKDPDTEHIVNDIFSYYFGCFSKRKTIMHIIEKYAEYPKCPTKYQVNRILSKEQYAGIYQEQKNYFPAYITPEQFQIIESNTDLRKSTGTGHGPYIFSGLIECPYCHGTMSGFVKSQKLKNGQRSQYRRYRCSKKFTDHQTPVITERIVEEYMIEHLCAELNDKIIDLRRVSLIKKKPSQRQELQRIKSEIERLNILFQKGRISEAYYDQEYDRLESKKLQYSDSCDIDATIRSLEQMQRDLSGNWIELYSKLDNEHKNVFWRRIISRIYIDKETHKICGFTFSNVVQ